MDLSDGLADGVRQLADASGVGAILNAEALPIDPGARTWFGRAGRDPIVEALRGGDDYELLITAKPNLRGRLLAARAGGAPLTKIGVCTRERDLRVRRTNGGTMVDDPLPAGFSHFR
jgi:thiamine-monophosphate kinase